MNYDHKRILITGASSGIGRALALALSPHQNTLVITARRAALLDSLAREIESRGSRCHAIAGDATDLAHAEAVVDFMTAELGGVDLAILNVGAGPATNTLTESADSILSAMRTNYTSLVQFFVPLMRQMQRQTGVCMIAHVNSLATYFGIPMQGSYAAAKAAGRILLETARLELEHFGHDHIRIQTIHPGFVATEACADDGIPAPNEISEEQAAQYILKGIAREARENCFPAGTSAAVRIGRIAPYFLRKRVLLAEVPERY